MKSLSHLIRPSILMLSLLVSIIINSQASIDSEDFQSGWGIWNDLDTSSSQNGDAIRTNSSTPNGTYSIRLLDNSGDSSSISTDNIDLTGYDNIDFTFDYHVVSFNGTEDFYIEFSNNSGSSWTQIGNYVRGTDFNNGSTYTPTINITNSGSTTFTSTSQLKIRCDASGNGDYLYIDNVDIVGTLASPTYCSSNGNNTNFEYIERVELNTINNISGAGSSGYSDFTTSISTTTLNTNTNYTINITPNSSDPEGYAVWIDYNQDGDFEDTGEQILSLAATTASLVSGNFSIPNAALSGNTRMRVSMQYNTIPTDCGSFSYGEVEDYTVNISSTPLPEINIQGNNNTISNGASSPNTGDHTEFSSIETSTTFDRTFTIQNTGSGTLNLNGSPIVNISGHSAFSILTQPSSNNIVSSGSDLSFVVRFAPTTDLTNAQATISITNDDTTGSENPYIFVVQGSSFTPNPEINIQGNNNDISNGSTTTNTTNDTEFGSINTLTTHDHTFTIQNTGSGTLNLNGLPIVNISGHSAFSILTQPSSNNIVSSGSDLTFVVRFAPTTDLTNAQATISIANNDTTGSENPYTFGVQGSSETPTPEINITGLGNSINDGDVSPSFSDDTHFGDVLITNTLTKTYTIENTGNANLDISSLSINNTAGNAFSIAPTNPAPATIPTGNSITFSVIFAPTSTSPNPYEAEVTILSTDTDESTYTFGIQGVGTENIVSAGPGNVSLDLQLWMRADEGIGVSEAINNTEVTSWGDQSSNALNAVKDGEPGPNYITDGLNFNPVLRFSRANQNYLTLGNPSALNIRSGAGISGRKDMTIIAAFVANGNSNAGSVISKASSSVRDYQLWLGDTDRVVHYTFGRDNSPSYDGRHWGRFNALNEPKITRGIAISSGLTSTVNGLTDNLVVNHGLGNGDSSNRDVLIGARRNSNNSDDANQLTGDVAEIIIYDRALTAPEAMKVESYLAIKYGITLGYNDSYRDGSTITNFSYSGTSNDYIASNGTTLWSGVANAGYGYNVFGIARDNNSNLLQSKSKSANVQRLSNGTLLNPILTIQGEAGSLTSNLSYLLIGHQGSDIALQTSTLPARTLNTISRQWKARESSTNVGTVQLEFDLSQYNITNEDQLNLIIANNASLNNYKNYEGTYNAVTDILTFTGIDLEDNDYFTLGSVETLNSDYHMSFNGSSQYIDLENNNDLTGDFTISLWVKYDAYGRVMVSKGGNSGYEFGFNGTGNLVMTWANSGTYSVTSNNSVPQNMWHHVAVIYNQSTAKLYIDGIENGSANISTSPINNTESCFIGASSSTPNNFYSGEMDELRIWNRALTIEQLRFVMNQEIENNGGNVYGKIIPSSTSNHDTSNIDWGDLLAYYPFSETRGNCLLNKSENINNGRLHNTTTSDIETQTAPLPYKSQANGSWDDSATWLNNSVQRLPNSFSSIDGITPIDWNIVEINNNIYLGATSTTVRNRNCSVEALIINSGDLQVNGNTVSNTGIGLTVTHYLKIDGSLDLEGESQLIQTTRSVFDASSTGGIERDQQGNSSTYTYNYWCSPVSSSTNTSYTVPSVITNVGFTSSGYNGLVSPLTNADYWIWKYINSPPDYANWQHLRSSGTLLSGEGFTMKGTGASTPEQNYIFEGQPNNGDISLNIDSGNEYFIGNPYPSAIDADAFIRDNLSTTDGGNNASGNIINGAIYFWDHFSENTHILSEYEGGYATYTLMGGAFAISNDPLINTSGAIGTSRPERFIPVGQGFFVSAKLDTSLINEANDPSISQPIVGGNILFKNSQRVFQKENVTATNSGSIFLKQNTKKNNTQTKLNVDERQKIRLSFLSPDGYRRELLVGADDNASNKFDLGYEAILIESNKADMYWKLNNVQLIIQAVNQFDQTQTLPLGLKTNNDGISKISIDNLINIPLEKEIYIHDLKLNTYHNLRKNDFEIYLSKGIYEDRFEITFTSKNDNSLNITEIENSNIEVYYNNEKRTLNIFNPHLNTIISTELFNILGQSIFQKQKNENKKNIEYPIKNISKGSYIINLKTQEGTLSKKVLIK